MQKKLIICADDFGLTKGINNAIINCWRKGEITVTTIMPNSPYFNEAANAVKCLKIPCGIHLTVSTEFDLKPIYPILKNTPKDRNGYLYPNIFPYLKHADSELVYLEFKAQILKVLDMDILPTHIDSHMHVFSFEILDRLSREFHLPCRDRFEHNPHEDECSFHMTTCGKSVSEKIRVTSTYIDNLEKKKSLIICHPTSDVDEMKCYVSNRFKGRYEWMTRLRFQDADCLSSSQVKSSITSSKVTLSADFK